MNKIVEKIKSDILLCDEAIQDPRKSYMLYKQLRAGYSALIPDFQNGLSQLAKIPGSNYVTEIVEIREKLKMYLLMDSIPTIQTARSNEMHKNKSKESVKGSVTIRKNDLLKTAFSTYKVVKQIEQGGNGTVYEVVDDDGKTYASKVVDEEKLTRDKRKRFKNEIHFCETHKHDNIISVEDKGIIDKDGKGYIFYVMPLYQSNLRAVMKKGMSPETVIQYFEQICNGLAFAHNCGCIHRDIKPENILIGLKEECVIADFGIAHFSDEDKITMVETKATSRLANFAYRAPEQNGGNLKCSAATDIYAVGLMLNEMFTGDIPMGANYKKIGAINSDYGFLDDMVDKMISQEQKNRYQTIDELLIDFRARMDIARKDRQISALSKPIADDGIKDKIYNNPITIIDMDIKSGALYITLSEFINLTWEQIFYHDSLTSYMSSPCCYKDFSISGRIATYRLNEFVNSDDVLSKLVSDFKAAIQITNDKYKEYIGQQHRQTIEVEILRRQKEIEKLENEKRMRDKLKKLI